MNDHLIRTSPPQHFDPNTRSDFIGFRMAAVTDMANIVFNENSFPDRNKSFSWNNLTTGQQAADIAATAAIVTFGAAIEAIAAIETASLEAETLEAETLEVDELEVDETLEEKRAQEFLTIIEEKNYDKMLNLIKDPSIKHLTEDEKSFAQFVCQEQISHPTRLLPYTKEEAKNLLRKANAPDGYIAREKAWLARFNK